MGDVVKQPSSEMSQVSHWHKIRSLTQLIVTNNWRMTHLKTSHPLQQQQYSPQWSEPQSDTRNILNTPHCGPLFKYQRWTLCRLCICCAWNWSNWKRNVCTLADGQHRINDLVELLLSVTTERNRVAVPQCNANNQSSIYHPIVVICSERFSLNDYWLFNWMSHFQELV